ncbi:hypothetical protein B0I03_10528 [Flavobacterium aquaticum]|uniref:Uncharacterized protein n=1 Tax=Flavobacterium aquaticum TaxID=1236486 RepID=A0A327YMW5_9FLAO|nr:hypothetical protein [Flavobacterium aquaticum]RAK21596.1 hypothetical protein B0I03_10528 [Flavobacterium aquaticum]
MKKYFTFLMFIFSVLIFSQTKKQLIAENLELKDKLSECQQQTSIIKSQIIQLENEKNILNDLYKAIQKNSMEVGSPSSQIDIYENTSNNLSGISKSFFLDTYNELEEIKGINVKSEICENSPTRLEELTGGYKVFYVSSNKLVEADGNLFLANVNSENSNTIVNYKFVQYKKGSCIIDGKLKKVIWGVGIDLKMKITSKKKKVDISSLPKLAAAVNYKEAEAQFSIDVIGITGQKIINNLNLSGEFNVENYGKVISAIDEIIKNISSEGVNIEPQLISIE